jgi:DNA-binding GntR family transcriptional regulator
VATAVPAPAALVDEIAATLQARVLRGEIPSGARLRQETIAADFGVSRTPVREALRKLQALGLVHVVPHKGAVVRAPSVREIREGYVVRAELEGLAASLAAELATRGQLERLQEAVALFRHCRDTDAELERWSTANADFHETVHEAAANDRLRAMLADLHKSFPRALTEIVLGEKPRRIEDNVEQHERILDAIAAHDGELARERMIQHVRNAGDVVVLRYEQRVS